MVRLTDSELDCVMNAARPLDVGARVVLLRKVAERAGELPRDRRRRAAAGRCRDSASTFSAAWIWDENARTSRGIWLQSSLFAGEHGSHPVS
jgi:hypothetical protein